MERLEASYGAFLNSDVVKNPHHGAIFSAQKYLNHSMRKSGAIKLFTDGADFQSQPFCPKN